MPGIIAALRDSGTGMSILTKGTLLRRDLPLLADADVPVSVAVSLAVGDAELQRAVGPRAGSAKPGSELITAIRDAG